MGFSSSPVDTWVIPCQPGVSQNDVVLLSEVHHKEVLCQILSIDSEVKLDLVADHPPALLIPSMFQVYMGHWSFSSGQFILLAKWRSMKQIVAPLSISAVVSAIFPFFVL